MAEEAEVLETEQPVVETETEPEQPEEKKPESEPKSDPVLDVLTDSQPDDSEEKPEESETDKPAEDTEKTEEETETETTPEVEPDPEEARKEEARRRYEEREQARAERQARVTEQTRPYLEAAEDGTDARLRAMEVAKYNETIEHNENTLVGEFERAKANPELQIFNPESPEFNKPLYDKAVKDYNAGYIEYDANGNMVGLKGSLYQHLNETAELYRGAIKSGAFKQVRDQRKMKINSDSKPAVSPKEPVVDKVLEILKSE